MELILKETIDTLGQVGEMVDVKAGYGRNYLLPQGKAVTATKQNKAILAQQQAVIAARQEEEKKQSEKLAKTLSGITLDFEMLTGSDNRIFGSVTSSDISQKLAESDIKIDKKSIILPDPIKELGEVKVSVKAGFQVTAEITVIVSVKSEDE